MPEAFAHDLRRLTGLEQERGVGVAEVVESNSRKLHLYRQATETLVRELRVLVVGLIAGR